MKTLKKILFALIGVISLYLVANFFFSDKFEVEKSVKINATPLVVFEQVNNFKNWENWDPWLKNEPSMKLNYNQISSGVGAVKMWQSENFSNGKMEIIESSFIDFVNFKITIDGWDSFDGVIKLEASENQVLVSWKDSGNLNFLMRVMGPLLNKMIGKDLQQGLNNLKTFCESIPAKSGEINVTEQNYTYEISIIDSCKTSEVQSYLSIIFNEIYTQLALNGITPKSAPFSQYLSFPKKAKQDDFVVLKAGVYSDLIINQDTNSRISVVKQQSKKIVECSHFGAYSTLNITHKNIEKYCEENNLSIIFPGYEFFESDPAMVPDLSKRETRVVYQLK